jgi:hypothetical protein
VLWEQDDYPDALFFMEIYLVKTNSDYKNDTILPNHPIMSDETVVHFAGQPQPLLHTIGADHASKRRAYGRRDRDNLKADALRIRMIVK